MKIYFTLISKNKKNHIYQRKFCNISPFYKYIHFYVNWVFREVKVLLFNPDISKC